MLSAAGVARTGGLGSGISWSSRSELQSPKPSDSSSSSSAYSSSGDGFRGGAVRRAGGAGEGFAAAGGEARIRFGGDLAEADGSDERLEPTLCEGWLGVRRKMRGRMG